jgi:hypothetical protein
MRNIIAFLIFSNEFSVNFDIQNDFNKYCFYLSLTLENHSIVTNNNFPKTF